MSHLSTSKHAATRQCISTTEIRLSIGRSWRISTHPVIKRKVSGKMKEQKVTPFFLSCNLRRFPDDCIKPSSERYPSVAPLPSTEAPAAARLLMLLHLRITSSLAANGGFGLGSRSGGSASGTGATVTPKSRIAAPRESLGIPATGVGGGVLLGVVGGT
jgi:hypothetical protein